MKRLLRLALVIVLTLPVLIVGAGPASAETQYGVTIDESSGSFTLPSTCAVKSSGGGCSTPQRTFYMVSGLPYGSQCLGANVYTTGNTVSGPCRIDNSAGSSGTASVTVYEPYSCYNWFNVDLFIDATNPSTIYFTDAGLVAWKLTSLHLTANAGTALPTGGFKWDLSGSFNATNLTNNNSHLSFTINAGEVTTSSSCSASSPALNFSFSFGGNGTALT
jgi:hypothetical protein